MNHQDLKARDKFFYKDSDETIRVGTVVSHTLLGIIIRDGSSVKEIYGSRILSRAPDDAKDISGISKTVSGVKRWLRNMMED